jgi:hypothetical protein
MERKLVLSSEDSERIRTWLSNQKWVDCEGRPITLCVAPEEHLLGLIEEWSSVVAEIEQGYKLTIYDYINDITVRDDIAEMMQLLTETGKSRLAEWVDPIDERFLRATREVPLPVSYPSAEPRDRWWWYRIPERLGEDLASDLCSIGLIERSD